MSVFEQNIEFIQEHNRKYDEGRTSYRLDENGMADLTHDEILGTYSKSFDSLISYSNERKQNRSKNDTNGESSKSLPERIDWRIKVIDNK